MSKPPFEVRYRLPPWPEDVTWLNTTSALDLADLRGKFVLLDFWTYCCINCMHILPELKKLERAYAKNLVVIGIHSAKFATEQDTRNIAEAIVRYQIEHPVINDADRRIWRRLGISAWPTLVLVDPEGYAVWAISGEITFEQLDAVLKPAVAYYRAKGLLDESPVHFALESDRAVPTPLRFPGKVLADEASGRLFIADSNHHRIVVARLNGTLLEIVGSGECGQADGDFSSAQFNQPQGMALRNDVLYVADTENHLIRAVDLAVRRVSTVAGLGYQSRRPARFRPADPRRVPLNSPWDLCLHNGNLYIAMAGAHQIWKMDVEGRAILPYAGSGREDIVDGPRVPEVPFGPEASALAQPSGLATDGTWLYVADSEGSSIRAVPLDPKQPVRTVVGTSHLPEGRLFTFGDVDGPPQTARLQHPLGVAYYQGRLYVADTYNNEIKVVDPATGRTATLVGTGEPGRDDSPARFDEPAGISAAAGRLFVADTNNHLVRVVELGDVPRVTTLTIEGLQPPRVAKKARPSAFDETPPARLPAVSIRPAEQTLRLRVVLRLPAGHKLNPDAPMSYRVAGAPGELHPGTGTAAALVREENLGHTQRLERPSPDFVIALPLAALAGQQTFDVAVGYYWCRESGAGLCRAGTARWIIPVALSPSAPQDTAVLEHAVR